MDANGGARDEQFRHDLGLAHHFGIEDRSVELHGPGHVLRPDDILDFLDVHPASIGAKAFDATSSRNVGIQKLLLPLANRILRDGTHLRLKSAAGRWRRQQIVVLVTIGFSVRNDLWEDDDMTAQIGACRLLLSSAAIFLFLAAAGSGCAQEIPKFDGKSLAAAPQQSAPWSAPETKLPLEAVQAISTVFDEGLADPRGCEYRQIEVVTGSCWGSVEVTKTRGWVLPADKPAFAVCWSGLVYPLVSAGPPADLRTDVEAMLKQDKEQLDDQRTRYDQDDKRRAESDERLGRKHERTHWPLRWNTGVVLEGNNVASAYIRPLKAALLLRLGEVALAEKVWSQWFGVEHQDPKAGEDPYATLADDWAWALYDRALCAHMRGDDHLSLLSAELLATLEPVIEAHAAKWKAAHPNDSDQPGKPTHLLGFLDALPPLLADQRRRATESAYTPTLHDEKGPQGGERITGLIRDLELVCAHQSGQPGGVNLAEDPIAQALIQTGDAAVEPLLVCLENDTRLTRSVSFHRDFFPRRTILSVYQAAYAVLINILHADFSGPGYPDGRAGSDGRPTHREMAERIRAYWQKNRDLSLEERWYRTLGDEASTPEEWFRTADNIVADDNRIYTRSGTSGDSWTLDPSSQPGNPPGMRGETLRAKTNPSVSELLVKRMATFSAPTDQLPDPNLQKRTRLALVLAKWDGRNHLDDLRAVSEALKQPIAAGKGNDGEVARTLLMLFQARIKAGDPTALADYATWLPTVPPKDLGFTTRQIFEILWQHPNEPIIREAAEKLFAQPDSPWVPLLRKNAFYTHELVSSSLVGLEAFRVELLRGLADKTTAGTATVEANGGVSMTVDNGWSGGGGGGSTGPEAPPVGTRVTFRECDLFAHELSNIEGAPRCELVWPEQERDKAVTACVRWLRRYGDRYQFQPQDDNLTNVFHRACFHLPPLDHPATPEDFEQGRAIFALEGERRVWKMPEFPLDVSWTTLKDLPRISYEQDADGKLKPVTSYETEGKVFQAEEVLVDGRWERFYGFVGPYHMDKVPAAEIKVLSDRMTGP